MTCVQTAPVQASLQHRPEFRALWLADKLKQALGMEERSPPPWLRHMQRYGPPPSYPDLKIPGLNAPIPPGCFVSARLLHSFWSCFSSFFFVSVPSFCPFGHDLPHFTRLSSSDACTAVTTSLHHAMR